MKKNSGKINIGSLVRKERRDIPAAIENMLSEHSDGYVLFYYMDGRLGVKQRIGDDAKALGIQTMARDYLNVILEEGKSMQKELILERIDET